MVHKIFHDNASDLGLRTRVFRESQTGGVEWMYAVDLAGGETRWFEFMPLGQAQTIEALKHNGMKLEPYKQPVSA